MGNALRFMSGNELYALGWYIGLTQARCKGVPQTMEYMGIRLYAQLRCESPVEPLANNVAAPHWQIYVPDLC